LAQIFPAWWNRLPLVLAAAGVFVPTVAVAGVWYYFSPWYTDVGYRPVQPVPYSHRLHVGELGLDCRYCHASVETSAVANIPPTRWIRVHQLPDFAYFAHNAHIAAGIGCVTCHGRIDEMDVVTQMKPLSMGWCLECHRNPGPNRRPVSEVTNMRWTPPRDGAALAAQLDRERPVNPPVQCSGCHR